MSEPDANPKFVAICESCETMTVSETRPDGTIRPIAVPEDCRCGEGEFRRLAE